MKKYMLRALTIATASVLLAPAIAAAQQNLWTGTTGNWTANTWNQFGPPDPTFDAEGVVGSSVGSGSLTGVVNVATDIRASNPSPTVILGDGGGTSGTMNITSSGAFAVVAQGLSATGDFRVGVNGGVGVLNVNGTLEVAGQLGAISGANNSAINLLGSATVTVGSAFLDRNLRIEPGVNFTATTPDSSGNGLILGAAGTHTWVIPASGPATLDIAGNADLSGTLNIEFNGVTPAPGATFNLIDAATIDAFDPVPTGFSAVTTSADTSLGAGQRFAVNTVGGGANGRLAQLTLEQHPVLVVNRQTGAVSITNPGSAQSIAFDNYNIESRTFGALNPGAWTSIAPAGGWVEANPSANLLAELNPNSSGTVAASSSINLGNAFTLPAATAFGVENEDLRFTYARPGGGLIEGEILYQGVPTNTLTLNVDPDTGEAQIVNGSPFTVSIDNYNILSASGSLLAGNSDWSSLQDQGASGGNWFESNSGANQLAELLIEGGLELGPNAIIDLGAPFDELNGVQDLVFTFAVVPSGDLPGDYNNDGRVDSIDYAVWREGLGTTFTSADFDVWRNNYGATGSAGGGAPALLTGKLLYGELVTFGGVVATPEPAALLLCLSGLALTARRRRRRE